ncbi:MAG: AmmeMemoRadiSam system protein B [Thermoanaerobaculia bacterium]|nr:AmmeMemoRadiSam system protein B [Thermoanaerobaculia bacterium]
MRLGRTASPGTRPPAVSGTFYPASPSELARHVDALLDAAGIPPAGQPPAALVVPHAGYVYSGPVAATAFARLRGTAASISRVVAFGPVHHVAIRGAAVPAADAWATPLGDVPIDPVLRERAVARGAAVTDRPHAPEHSLEVQLPFLQRSLAPGFGFLPVAVSDQSAAMTADLMEAFFGETGTLVVVSTDLSHYHDLATARLLDRRTADAILAREPEKLSGDGACGFYPLRGLVELARKRDLSIELLDLRTSGDTAGDPERVVGYGAFAIGRPA